jgi:predicted lipoprotein with Yx(FWY)xxD motif
VNRSPQRHVLARPVLLVAFLSAAACGAPQQPAPDPAAPPSAAQHGGHGGHGAHSGNATELWAVQSGPLGVVVTDGSGHLMYRSDADRADPPTSTCTGACTQTWIPVTVDPDQEPELAGVDGALVGRFQRPDGTTQLTLAGWPLYRQRDDDGTLSSAGQHGADGTWFVVTPKGEKATPA